MRRQLYRSGGITSLYPRQGFGLGSKIKERIRKLIPNELADVAVKAAPFVAPFNPGIAALMRGVGRFDQRGSISDALKQGALTYGGGQLVRQLGGAGVQKDFLGTPGDRLTTPLSQDRMEGLRNLFKAREKTPVEGKPEMLGDTGRSMDQMSGALTSSGTKRTGEFSLQGIMDKWNNLGPGMQTAIVGAGSGALAGVAQWFENQIPQEPGESMEEYIARRKVAVGKLMRQYMDNTRAYDAEWTTMTNEQKDAEVAKYNMNKGGRVGYGLGDLVRKNMPTTTNTPTGISMGNTLAQNIAANRAQAAANQGVLQAARDKLINKYVDQPSILGPATQQAARTMIDRNLESEAALDMLNKTSMSPTGITATDTGQAVRIGSGVPEEYDSLNKSYTEIQAPTTRTGMEEAWATRMVRQDPITGESFSQDRPFGEVVPDFDKYGKYTGTDPYISRSRAAGLGTPTHQLVKLDDGNYYMWNGSSFSRIDPNQIERDYYAGMYNQGGRVGLKHGTPEMGIKSLDAGAIGNITYKGNEGPQSPLKEKMMMADVSNMRQKLFDMGYDWINDADDVTVRQIYDSEMGTWTDSSVWRTTEAKGGRIGYRMGMGPAGLPGIPRMAPDGMEFDMRQNGGFQPLGAKEKKDDVPAMLAKNEFVFTADAVRGAGDGDIEKGAQRMYDTMQKLEKRVV